MMAVSKVRDVIWDWPKGMLDTYRKRASFDWKSMKINLEGEESIRFQVRLWKFIETSKPFQKVTGHQTLDDMRRRCNTQMKILHENGFSPITDKMMFNTLCFYDGSLPVKLGIVYGMVPSTILALGTDRHFEYFEKFAGGELMGCFALTEVSHGTNVKGMKTTATYDPHSKSFILHSPNFEAAKCWVGGLGKTATHAVVFADLITPDKVRHGLHLFIVPIRDLKTHKPFPGVTVGDMGEKVGLNGVDNGFVMFNNYRIPANTLLNKTADITEDGKYVTSMKDESKRFGASLGALSSGRVSITGVSTVYLTLAIIIATRYSAVRKQFGPNPHEEWPIIEYQAQQTRLFPFLASAYAMKIFSQKFLKIILDFQMGMITGQRSDDFDQRGMEIHALSSATKALCSWMARDGIQECREACGGHGYLKVARLGDIRAENDPNCTYEGENNVLIQQASNWLLSVWSGILQGNAINSPLGSVTFLKDAINISHAKFTHTSMQDALKPENLLEAYQWLVCYYLKRTHEKVENLRQNGYSDFEARNDSQHFYAKTLSLVYAECAVLNTFIEKLKNSAWNNEERIVLTKLCSLFAATNLERRLSDLFIGGFATPHCGLDKFLREGIIILCKELVNEAVTLVDVIAPPDFVLNSALGMSDGDVYKHLEKSFFEDENLERPVWWGDIIKSKL